MIAARFRHYEDRDGGPLPDDHVVLSVKVRRVDGRRVTLHTRPFLEYAVALSEFCNQRPVEDLCQALSPATAPRCPTAGQRPVTELAGIPDQLDWTGTPPGKANKIGEPDVYEARRRVRHRHLSRRFAVGRTRRNTASTGSAPDLRRGFRHASCTGFSAACVSDVPLPFFDRALPVPGGDDVVPGVTLTVTVRARAAA
ncbi:relaxase domain-containing protein [Streptomyces sp. NPDC059224]|uniref:relaxase domain-containing protein n=1 Tax=Streptomyces sp. NPDC059224 TaxID=3346775 RepID=UPI0036914E15